MECTGSQCYCKGNCNTGRFTVGGYGFTPLPPLVFDPLTGVATPIGWKCPNCGSVYNPTIAECHRCNAPLTAKAFTQEVDGDL